MWWSGRRQQGRLLTGRYRGLRKPGRRGVPRSARPLTEALGLMVIRVLARAQKRVDEALPTGAIEKVPEHPGWELSRAWLLARLV